MPQTALQGQVCVRAARMEGKVCIHKPLATHQVTSLPRPWGCRPASQGWKRCPLIHRIRLLPWLREIRRGGRSGKKEAPRRGTPHAGGGRRDFAPASPQGSLMHSVWS